MDTFSTPSQDSPYSDAVMIQDRSASLRSWESSSANSILRSSSRYTPSIFSHRKRVKIVSPIKWEPHNTSAYGIGRRRQLIYSIISYGELQRILRSMGYATSGGYSVCADRLLQSEWIPDRCHIERDERLRAKPVQNSGDRCVKLQCGDVHYLANFHINELKKWLKTHHITQPSRASKIEYIRLIQQHFGWQSPSPDSVRFKMMPQRPCRSGYKKLLGRTPTTVRHQQLRCDTLKNIVEHDNNDDDGDDDDEKNDAQMLQPQHVQKYSGDHSVRMQLCFDD
mmetsp:Transcript_35774/g.58671  ORF Transcript_35774/g.58671 Transcript_35774/m.58671 type:complete len:281 (-) Transcript_35774:713-1555(-)